MARSELVHPNLELIDAQSRHLAQFLKRVGFSDFERHASSQDEARAMQEAAAVVRKALAEMRRAPLRAGLRSRTSTDL